MGKAVSTTKCPQCESEGRDRSGDNLVVYADGSTYCFACGHASRSKRSLVQGEVMSLEKTRGITEDTCRFYGYKVGKYTGTLGIGGKKRELEDEWVRIMEWHDDDGNVVMQKIKSKDKLMKLVGDTSCKRLWGMEKFRPNEKIFVTVTEGEEDAMALAQVQGCQFPVVSVGSAQTAAETLRINLPWLQKFKYVVLALDNDEAGRAAINQILASDLFEPGRVKVAEFPLKDANEMLLANKHKEMIDCVLRAKVREPDHVVTVDKIIDQILEQPKVGIDMPWRTWTDWTYGLRFNEITTLVGPSGCGKTEIVKDIVTHLLSQMNVGVFSFEQTPADTIRRYAGARLGLKLQKPGEKWDPELIRKTAMDFNERVFLYNFNGTVDLNDIFHSIRYMNKAKGCRWFVIDNLKSLKVVMRKEECADFAVKLKALVKELNIHVMLVSHVNKDGIKQSTHVGFSSKVDKPHEGLTKESIDDIMEKFAITWETGRIPTASNIEGGNDIEAISDYVIGIGRNKQSKDPVLKRTITLKLLKEGRIDSDHRTNTFQLYRNDQGLLEEREEIDDCLKDSSNVDGLPF